MSEEIVTAGVPEVIVGQTVPGQAVPPSFSGKWEDFSKDMAQIEAESKPPAPAQPVSVQPLPAVVTPKVETQPTPQQTQAPTTPAVPAAPVPEVPDKFKTPDGKLDQEKVLKSYAEAERELKRLQNAKNAPAPVQIQQPQAQPPQQAMAPTQLTEFEVRVAQDLINEAASLGYQMPQAQAVAQARVQIRLMEAKHQADIAATSTKIAQFEQRLEDEARMKELNSLAQNAPWVATPQGQADLVRVLNENPHLLTHPEKWRQATLILLGERALGSAPVAQVNMPTPTGSQQPPLPVTPAQPAATPIPLNTPQEVQAYLQTLTPQQEAEFWTKAGYKWEVPNSHFKGL